MINCKDEKAETRRMQILSERNVFSIKTKLKFFRNN